jgi:pimeloyl-ACP methyl ester carboxylesterase
LSKINFMRNILLLHGALGAKNQFDELVSNLQQYKCHTLNFSGHGRKSFRGDFSISSFGNEVLEYLDENEMSNIDIFGYSMGGYVALYLALKHPERVGKIFTLATKFDWNTASAEREAAMLDAEKIEQKVPAFAAQLAERHTPNDWKMVLEKTKNMMLDLGASPSLPYDALSQIEHQVLIAVGEKDKMVSVLESELAASKLRNGARKIFENMPHPLEQIEILMLKTEIEKFFG